MERLTVENLRVTIGDRVILKNISTTLDKGELLMIIGESGSGKTTFSKLLLGILPQGSQIEGNIHFDNTSLLGLKEKEWKKYRGVKIAYIAQNPMSVFNDFQSIGSHAIELFKSQLGLSRKESMEKMRRLMGRLDLKEPDMIMGKYPFQLSGGMLQRIMLAMMMQLEPELLIADEPTSALDSENREKVLEMLEEYRDRNNALIIITHDYSLLRRMGGRLLIMKDGTVAEEGDTERILRRPESEYGKMLLLRKERQRYRKRNRLL